MQACTHIRGLPVWQCLVVWSNYYLVENKIVISQLIITFSFTVLPLIFNKGKKKQARIQINRSSSFTGYEGP